MLRAKTLVVFLFTLFLLAGCGQKGALYMPNKVEIKVKKAPDQDKAKGLNEKKVRQEKLLQQ